MKLINYMNLNQHPIHLSFNKDRTTEFDEIYHSHQGVELLYVHNGFGRVITGGNMIELRKGVLFIFRPFSMHRVKIYPEKEPYIRSLIVFEPSAMQKYFKLFDSLQLLYRNLFMDPFSQITYTEIPDDKFESLVNQFSSQTAVFNASEKLESEALFLISLINILKCYINKDSLKTQLQSITADPIRQAFDWLEKHFTEEFNLNKLADEVHLSPNHLSYLFRKETGSCISDYLAVRRIQEACMLLRTTSLSVEAVGNKIGLSNFSYFCKFFKMYIGMTPYNFKKTHK